MENPLEDNNLDIDETEDELSIDKGESGDEDKKEGGTRIVVEKINDSAVSVRDEELNISEGKSGDQDEKEGSTSMVIVVKNKDGAKSASEEGIIEEGKSGGAESVHEEGLIIDKGKCCNEDEKEGGTSIVVEKNKDGAGSEEGLIIVDRKRRDED